MKLKIKKNVGLALVKQRRFGKAIEMYEDIMNDSPEFDVGFNLIVCLYALAAITVALIVVLVLADREIRRSRPQRHFFKDTGEDLRGDKVIQPVSLLILDINMPDITGIEVLKHVKKAYDDINEKIQKSEEIKDEDDS